MQKFMNIDHNQLFWLEEKPHCFVEVFTQPSGENFKEGMFGQMIKISDLPKFILDNSTKNLWRSREIFNDSDKIHSIGYLPPFIDIDDESDRDSPNLIKAYKLTKTCSNIILENWAKKENRIRIIFSGHKGFHIEFKPLIPINLNNVRSRIISACKKIFNESNFNTFFNTTVIDPIKHEARLTNSFNSWYDNEGKISFRKVVMFPLVEFNQLELDDILAKAPYKITG